MARKFVKFTAMSSLTSNANGAVQLHFMSLMADRSFTASHASTIKWRINSALKQIALVERLAPLVFQAIRRLQPSFLLGALCAAQKKWKFL